MDRYLIQLPTDEGSGPNSSEQPLGEGQEPVLRPGISLAI